MMTLVCPFFVGVSTAEVKQTLTNGPHVEEVERSAQTQQNSLLDLYTKYSTTGGFSTRVIRFEAKTARFGRVTHCQSPEIFRSLVFASSGRVPRDRFEISHGSRCSPKQREE
jgi:hypothetical protein